MVVFDINAFKELSIGLVVFGVFSCFLLIQLWYYLFYFIRLAFYKPKQTSKEQPPVSVVICARNEDDNLVEYLPKIFNQDYPSFEVVVVNDCSEDNTGEVLTEFSRKHGTV